MDDESLPWKVRSVPGGCRAGNIIEVGGVSCHLLPEDDTRPGELTKQWKMAIEIVDFPMKHGDFPLLC